MKKKLGFCLSLCLILSATVSAQSIECKEKDNGNSFILRQQPNGKYSLVYHGVLRVFGEGNFKFDPTELANQLECEADGAETVCHSPEKLVLDIPRAGIKDRTVERESTFKIGPKWVSITNIATGAEVGKSLHLVAEYHIPTDIGEVAKVENVKGKNVKTGEEMDFTFDKSHISMTIDQKNGGYCEVKK